MQQKAKQNLEKAEKYAKGEVDWGGWLEPKYVETALPGAG